MTRATALILTAMTGFSGLVYEVVWQKYLATLLGSHSEATATVLAIFLGGLSLGYWFFGALTRREIVNAQEAGLPPRLLFIYGCLEFGIGVYVVVFPWLFEIIQALSLAIPHGAGGVGFAMDVLLTVVLVGPATVAMGGTIPILTQALAKDLEDATRFHALVYALNTAGAFAGALAAGFVLIPWLGLVTVLYAMGAINLFAGSVFMLIGRKGGAVVSLSSTSGSLSSRETFHIYHAVALLTGFAMMSLQTTAIRVAGLSFGSSQFTFSMVVAVFVLCIALGSFVVSTFDRISKGWVVANQWLLALAFAVLYFQVEKSPYWVHALRSVFRSTDASFAPFHTAGFLSILVMIGVPVVISGAVLPLLFHLMRREADHLGDVSGRLYGWNTVGSLLGALLGGYVLFFWFEMHEIYRIAVAALGIGAVALTVRVFEWSRLTSGIALVCIVGGLISLPEWDYRNLHSGLFRHRTAMPGTDQGFEAFNVANDFFSKRNTVFVTDDPIASVMAYEIIRDDAPKSLSILVNGKSDGNTLGDHRTMSLLATIPALLAERAERGFVIGWGTGVTAGQLALLDSIQTVDVAEISPGVIAASPLFDFANGNASTNPKINVIQSDAYRALVRTDKTFDVIISEPSNPWVTGIEMLFSQEFLEVAKGKLSPGGVYGQWYHEYETNPEVLEIVLRTYASVFDHVAVWRSVYPDLLLIGFDDPDSALDIERLEKRMRRPDFRRALHAARIQSIPEMLAHELLPQGVVHALELQGPVHSLYHPILSDAAGRAFFSGGISDFSHSGASKPAAAGRANSLIRRYVDRHGGKLQDPAREAYIMEVCRIHGFICLAPLAEWMHEAPESPGLERTKKRVDRFIKQEELRLAGRYVRLAKPPDLDVMSALFRTQEEDKAISSSDMVHLQVAQRASREYRDFYFHGSPFEPSSLEWIWSQCGESPMTRRQCAAEVRERNQKSPVSDFVAEVDRCMEALVDGPACKEGRDKAHALIDSTR